MSALAILAVLHLAKACAPIAAPATLLPIALAESRLDPLAIHDNTTAAELTAPDAPAATAIATRLIGAGHSVDLGLAQINWQAGHLQARGLSIAAAFDPCVSLMVGAGVLAQCWERAAGSNPQARLRSAIGCYNTGSTERGATYVRLVLAQAAEIVPALEIETRPASAPARLASPRSVPRPNPFIGQSHGASAITFPQSKDLP